MNTSHLTEQTVQIPTDDVALAGTLSIPKGGQGLVMFAHGSGSSRHSPRNRFVARILQEGGLATLLMDLLSEEEEKVDMATAHLRFDIPLLGERLVAATAWATKQPSTREFRFGYFGSSTGAAAALVAAARRPDHVAAIVSRGGRPDLAKPVLDRVRAPTLLIVGGNDEPVIEMNQSALALLQVEKQLEIVPGATHLFEEPGTLERVADLARDWFRSHLAGQRDGEA
jgi:dienelactone hydrolase